jgi:hypothetical protein
MSFISSGTSGLNLFSIFLAVYKKEHCGYIHITFRSTPFVQGTGTIINGNILLNVVMSSQRCYGTPAPASGFE